MVLLYVLGLYLAYNILTRADDIETALSHAGASMYDRAHLPATVATSIANQSGAYPSFHTSNNGMYTLSFPSQSTFAHSSLILYILGRLMTYVLIYPSVLIFNTLSFCLHYISVTLVLALYATHYLFLPFTETFFLLGRTFFVAPGRIAMSIARLFYPAYVLLGGLVGIGTSLGLCAGWVGRKVEKAIYAHSDEKRAAARRISDDHAIRNGRAATVSYSTAPLGSTLNGTPFRPGRRSQNRYSTDGIGLGLGFGPDGLPKVNGNQRQSLIKFLEPSVASYYDSDESEDDDDGVDEYMGTAEGIGSGRARQTRPSSHRIPSLSSEAGTPNESQQAFHFHFHPSPSDEQVISIPGLRSSSTSPPTMTRRASIHRGRTSKNMAREGSEGETVRLGGTRTTPAAQGVRRRSKILDRASDVFE